MTSATPPHHVCSWIGISEDDEHEITCGRPAQYVLIESSGQRTYACTEHLGEVHARVPGAMVEHNAQHIDDEGKPRITPESSITWQ